MADSIVSVGIDIGTTTSHLSISRLRIANTATGNQIARLAVTQKEIIYKSKIYGTPLNLDASINAEGVAELLADEYRTAGMNPKDIDTGAVIITGETARLRNARQVSQAISEMAGEFVVASAGPRLESLLAGRGSGAESASRTTGKTICNIDIGGGTCNYAVFRDGEMIDSTCLGIAGRFVQFDKFGQITRFTESGETFLDGVAKLSLLPVGSKPDIELIELLAALLSEVILHVVTPRTPPQIVQRLLQTEPLRHDYQIDELWFSGGVAECMRAPAEHEDPFLFGDMGILLSQMLEPALADRSFPYKIAETGIRSTVIGAGMHSLQLSGCTIMVSENTLPLRNVRIVNPFQPTDAKLTEAEIKSRLQERLNEQEIREENSPIAIAVCDLSALTYCEIQTWARALSEIHRKRKVEQPLIVLSRQDIGLALGQTIKQCDKDLELVILDNVDCSVGDQIDIGKPLESRQAVPLTVKTLIFET